MYRATRLTWGDIVAIRVFPAPRRTLIWRTAEVDIQRLTGWRHPSVVNVREVVIADDVAHVVMDFAGGGSLTEVLTARGTHLSMLEAISIGEQTAAALAAGHSRGVVHRAVRAHNLLFDDDSRVKLADLGFGSLRDPHDTRLRSGVPTIRDIAPEVVDGQEPSEAADVYQFGAMLTHLTRDRPGSRPPNTRELRQASDRMRALFAACLTPSPRTRPTAVGLHDELSEIAVSLGQEPATTTTLPTRTAEPSAASVPVQTRATVGPLTAPSTDDRPATPTSTNHHPATRTSDRCALDRTRIANRRPTTGNRTATRARHPATRTSNRHANDGTHPTRRPATGDRTAASTYHHPATPTNHHPATPNRSRHHHHPDRDPNRSQHPPPPRHPNQPPTDQREDAPPEPPPANGKPPPPRPPRSRHKRNRRNRCRRASHPRPPRLRLWRRHHSRTRHPNPRPPTKTSNTRHRSHRLHLATSRGRRRYRASLLSRRDRRSRAGRRAPRRRSPPNRRQAEGCGRVPSPQQRSCSAWSRPVWERCSSPAAVRSPPTNHRQPPSPPRATPGPVAQSSSRQVRRSNNRRRRRARRRRPPRRQRARPSSRRPRAPRALCPPTPQRTRRPGRRRRPQRPAQPHRRCLPRPSSTASSSRKRR